MKKITLKLEVFDFGKHKGETLSSVLKRDPQYILWLYENEIVDFPESIVIEAEQNDDE